ncbi:MAG: hypothetical protein HKN26_06545 [Acidimicrobiales bacterium]|nr:hypothetical protein [Acidimicrobiales bacterium]
MSEILIIDSDRAARMYLKLILTEAGCGTNGGYESGHEVAEAHTVAEGLRRLTSGSFDLVFLGDRVGDHSGAEFLGMAKSYDLAVGSFMVLLSNDPLVHADLDMRGLSPVVLPAFPTAEKALWLAETCVLARV